MANTVITATGKTVQSSSRTSLQAQIANRKWEEAENMMVNTYEYEASAEITEAVTKNNHIIHFACQFNPPLHIIRYISRRNPSSCKTVDLKGRYPLHVAAKYGASPEVMQFLLLATPHAAETKDQFGKSPIHYLGECYAKSFESSNTMVDDIAALRLMNKNMLQIAKLLNRAAPMAAKLKDENGKTAIEYAIAKRADDSIINAMKEELRRKQNSRVRFSENMVTYFDEDSSETGKKMKQLEIGKLTV